MIAKGQALPPVSVHAHHYAKNLRRHQKFLGKFGSFPNSARKAGYRDLLALPLNTGHFQELSKAYQVLPEHGLNKEVAFLTEALIRLHPQLNSQLLPAVIHPFVRLFKEDCLFSFECSLAFLLNWFHPMLVEVPNPPRRVMDIFARELVELNKAVNKFEYPISSVVFPMFVVNLTDVLNRQDWLTVFDWLMANPFQPELYLTVGLAILKSVQGHLAKQPSIEEVSLSLRKEKKLHMGAVIESAKALRVKYETDLKQIYSGSIFPIPQTRYPIFKFTQTPTHLMYKQVQQNQESGLKQMRQKFQNLEQFMERTMRDQKLCSSQELQDQYRLIYAQVQEYTSKAVQEYEQKIKVLKEVEKSCTDRLCETGATDKLDNRLGILDQRAQIQKQIEALRNEAEEVREMDGKLISQVQQRLNRKENDLRGVNRALRQQF